jgi:hypothetical protein
MLSTPFNLFVAGVSLWLGTRLLSKRLPNVWLATGVALFLFTHAFDSAVRIARPWLHRALLWRLRVRYAGLLVAACLCSVGSAMYGGQLGSSERSDRSSQVRSVCGSCNNSRGHVECIRCLTAHWSRRAAALCDHVAMARLSAYR